MIKRIVTLSLAASIGIDPLMAETLLPGSSLSGYQCYAIDVQKIGISRDDAWAGRGFPPVFDAPRADANRIGVSPAVVYVAWPLDTENGFVRVLRGTGKIGWLSADAIRPLYHASGSSGGCVLSWNGDRIQVHLNPGTKAWLWPDHDKPE
jgi:hypothetical protein